MINVFYIQNNFNYPYEDLQKKENLTLSCLKKNDLRKLLFLRGRLSRK